MLAESWIPTIAYDSCRIMVYQLTQLLDPYSDNAKALSLAAIPLLRSNINALKLMGSLNAIGTSLVSRPFSIHSPQFELCYSSPPRQKQCLIVPVLSPSWSPKTSYLMTRISQLRRKRLGYRGCLLDTVFSC